MPDRDNLRDVAAALAIVGAALLACSLLFPRKAHAQFSAPAVVTVPGSVTSDAPVEQAAGDMDTVQLPAILQQDTNTANSVTTGGGGGDYQPNAQYISSLDEGLFSGVNAQNFGAEFPGWVALPPDSTDTVSIPLVTTVLHTYGQALATAQSQMNELQGESFAPIEQTSTTTTALLTAMQANTEAVLAVGQELQLTRQLVATLITVEATKAAEELNERAQEGATNAMSFNLGTPP